MLISVNTTVAWALACLACLGNWSTSDVQAVTHHERAARLSSMFQAMYVHAKKGQLFPVKGEFEQIVSRCTNVEGT